MRENERESLERGRHGNWRSAPYDKAKNLHGERRVDFNEKDIRYRFMESSFRIEHKIYSFRIINNGATIRILERTKNNAFFVDFDLGGLWWFRQTIEEGSKLSSDSLFARKYRGSRYVLLCQRMKNKGGAFLEVSKFGNGKGSQNLKIPEGRNGLGWGLILNHVNKILSPTQRKESSAKRVISIKAPDIVKETGKTRSYAKVVSTEETQKDWSCAWEQSRMVGEGIKRSIFLNTEWEMVLYDQINVGVERWNAQSNKLGCAFECRDGWIDIHGLPFNLWKYEMFRTIGDKCGGLIQVDDRTSRLVNLRSARIKVKGIDSGFLEHNITVTFDGEQIELSLAPVSRVEDASSYGYGKGNRSAAVKFPFTATEQRNGAEERVAQNKEEERFPRLAVRWAPKDRSHEPRKEVGSTPIKEGSGVEEISTSKDGDGD
ncbi:hypothetical protein ACS0TY_027305 [Phlomoides rotata]